MDKQYILFLWNPLAIPISVLNEIAQAEHLSLVDKLDIMRRFLINQFLRRIKVINLKLNILYRRYYL